MESIAEERSELAMDIAQAVVEKLDIDRKLDERLKELMLRGDKIFRDIQVRQDSSTENLSRTVAHCLESQRAFQEEHQRLLGAVKELALLVQPLVRHPSLSQEALEAHHRANAITKETESLEKTMEEHRRSTQHAAELMGMSPATPSTAVGSSPATVSSSPAKAAPSPAGDVITFHMTLRKADETTLGLSVNAEGEDLVVEEIREGGAVDSWNKQFPKFGDRERVIAPGDNIVSVNGIVKDTQKMLQECTEKRTVKLVISRRFPTKTSTSSTATPVKPQPASSACAAIETPEKVSQLREKAPDFVPIGVNAAPLKQTQPVASSQHISAPPGLFFPRVEADASTTEFLRGYAMNIMQEESSEEDKEN